MLSWLNGFPSNSITLIILLVLIGFLLFYGIKTLLDYIKKR